MKDPFAILELSSAASDDEVRRRYLELVRRHPPERDPERFAEIRAAYDALRDPANRLKTQLFELTANDTFEDIQAAVNSRGRRTRVGLNLLLSLGRR